MCTIVTGAAPFMAECLGAFAQAFPHAQLESRADSAFLNEQIVDGYEQLGVEFSLSVPFERSRYRSRATNINLH